MKVNIECNEKDLGFLISHLTSFMNSEPFSHSVTVSGNNAVKMSLDKNGDIKFTVNQILNDSIDRNTAPLPILTDDLNLRVSTLNRLLENGITSTYRLIKCSEVDLLKMSGIGKKAINEIVHELALHNLRLMARQSNIK
ncbi:DNA-directed RNA polymerase subunit alpha C-terminal domain-containing protein [Providencia sp.]|uniref:DNA-directed RNA polymerase subunit alpha C-terminal domain-containing protein n=1 Tax=Providencia sp. TaxID=589 RepID=UPI003F9AD75F